MLDNPSAYPPRSWRAFLEKVAPEDLKAWQETERTIQEHFPEETQTTLERLMREGLTESDASEYITSTYRKLPPARRSEFPLQLLVCDARIILAHRHSTFHRQQLFESDVCGCFCCSRIFPATSIWEWIDHDQTALCPSCGIDSVIGSTAGFPIDYQFLHKMWAYWFAQQTP